MFLRSLLNVSVRCFIPAAAPALTGKASFDALSKMVFLAGGDRGAGAPGFNHPL
jgi:hypothetical protein